MSEALPLVRSLDWGSLAPLHLRARAVASGVMVGMHRSLRRGSGVEFGGHRHYVPGDDLRFLDRRAMLRHDRLLVREFETETERGLRLLVDASRSMAYRSESAPGAKLAYAAVIAAALGRIALADSDTVSLDFIGGDAPHPVAPRSGTDTFERILQALESVGPGGDAVESPDEIDAALTRVGRMARRGSVVVLLSDFLDLPEGTEDKLAALAAGGRIVVGVRVLDPVEATFPFEGPVRLRSSEGGRVVETEGAAARAGYLDALARLGRAYESRLVPTGGRFLDTTTLEDPVALVRRLVAAIAGAPT
jgi:uncharacterized protein (DUF58 family)